MFVLEKVGLNERINNTGKTSIFTSLVLAASWNNMLGSIDALGTKRLFFIYCGINQPLSKLCKFIAALSECQWSTTIFATHSSTPSLLSFMLPLIGISIAERIKD